MVISFGSKRHFQRLDAVRQVCCTCVVGKRHGGWRLERLAGLTLAAAAGTTCIRCQRARQVVRCRPIAVNQSLLRRDRVVAIRN